MEAIVLAGGKGERLGEAAQGLPKPLVPVGGRPLVSYELERLRRAGVTRVVFACSDGQEDIFERELAGYGP
jgi:NDP-sugar pyrophosphorylase family protein